MKITIRDNRNSRVKSNVRSLHKITSCSLHFKGTQIRYENEYESYILLRRCSFMLYRAWSYWSYSSDDYKMFSNFENNDTLVSRCSKNTFWSYVTIYQVWDYEYSSSDVIDPWIQIKENIVKIGKWLGRSTSKMK